MIADELERAFCQLIVSLIKTAYPSAASGGTLADGGDTLIATLPIGLSGTLMQDGQTEMSDDNDIPIDAGTMFRVYRGAGSEVVQYPCAIVTTDHASEDFDTGNVSVTATVKVVYQVDNPDESTSRADLQREAANVIMDGLRTDDLPGDLNSHRIDATRLTVQGLESAAHQQSREGRTVHHEMSFGLYCAGLDLT